MLVLDCSLTKRMAIEILSVGFTGISDIADSLEVEEVVGGSEL